ncbi:endophilin-A isoform X1 [Bradysia coprophila]|uniref:endophilin-A isoform X1 n=1 Tax=Bradysia coprophila TaxID=38358 RepID=UPI00187DA375|nr:endophilin-A isoform X1 [Bradysia coprophila]XP_037033254.1 endophilin-A isoform X1 [Bradysia coprophila]
MAFAGLKKQINKANQYVTEKMGGAEGTKLDHDFMDMETKTDVTVELVEELQIKTKEFLQPNPTARAKMAAVKGISKLSGQAKSNTYPQPEGLLADCMLLYGKKLGDNSIFAESLIEMGESLRQMADVKYSLDDNIKQNFLEPLHHLQTKDLKEVMHHRKKLQGRRLDYDCKRRRQTKGSNITDEEIRGAEDKFAESLLLAQTGMYNLLANDVEQVSQMVTFAEGLYDFHQQCTEILKILVETLQQKREECANRPRPDFVPKTLADLNIEGYGSTDGGMNGGRFIHPNSHLSRNKANNSHQNVYSSQQNLSKINSNNNNSNFQRSRIYGSQQSLSTVSNRSSTYSIQSNSKSTTQNSFTNMNYNNHSNNNPSSPDWLNAWNSPPSETMATRVQHTHSSTHSNNYSNRNAHFNDPWTASPLPSPMRSPARTPMVQQRPSGPHCTALYDFEPENPGELGFKENDTIQLLNKVDENWFEGSVNGRTGYFPQSYVTIVVPLP